MKKFALTLLLLALAVFLAAPFLAGSYVEKTLRERVATLTPEVKLTSYQRGYLTSRAEIVYNAYRFPLLITHAPLSLTGFDLARGKSEEKEQKFILQLDWQQNLTIAGQIGEMVQEIKSTGKFTAFPQTSVSSAVFHLPPQDGTIFSPFTLTIHAEQGAAQFLIPNLRLQNPDCCLINVANIRRKEMRAGGNELTIEKITFDLPALNVSTTWRDVLFSDRLKMRPDGQTLSYLLHFSAQREKLAAGGALQFLIAPLRSILPDQISADLALHGINKQDRHVLLQHHWQKDELLQILKRNLAAEEISADFTAHLLRRQQGINIQFHLQENIDFAGGDLFATPLENLYPLWVGSWLKIDIADFMTNNFLLREFFGGNPEQVLQSLGFYHTSNGWHLRVKINDNGQIDYQNPQQEEK